MEDKHLTTDFSDLIIFIDENNETKEMYVNIISLDPLISFKTKAGNVMSIPHQRLIKLKQKGGNDDY
jgi:hypothetical protein